MSADLDFYLRLLGVGTRGVQRWPRPSRVCRNEGLFALWRGWVPSVIGVVPYMGLNFGVYETAKDLIIKYYW